MKTQIERLLEQELWTIKELNIRSDLMVGFDHGPLRMQEYRDYAETIRAIATAALHRAKEMRNKNNNNDKNSNTP